MLTMPPAPPAWDVPTPAVALAVIAPNAVMAAPVLIVTLPALRPVRVLPALTAPPSVAMVPALSVPVVVMLTWPPRPLALPAVDIAPTVALLPVSVTEPTAPPVPAPVAAPVWALMVLVFSVPVPVMDTTPAAPPV